MLSKVLLEKAKQELGEDENRREQSLERFREWLKKHSFIKCDSIDDIVLLLFLRGKKFVMDKALESFENFVVFHKSHPKWNEISIDEIPIIAKYCRNCLGLLKYTKPDESRIFVTKFKKIEDEPNATTDSCLKAFTCFINGAAIYEEDSQVTGFEFIHDYTGVTTKLFSIFPVTTTVEFHSQMKFAPLRIKQIYIVGLPSFAAFFMEIMKKILPDKIRKRLKIVSNYEELAKVMDTKKILNDKFEYINENFMQVEEMLMLAKKTYESFEVNMKKANEKKFETLGNFRKLEID